MPICANVIMITVMIVIITIIVIFKVMSVVFYLEDTSAEPVSKEGEPNAGDAKAKSKSLIFVGSL